MPSELVSRLVEAFHWLDPGPHTTHLVSDATGWWRDPRLLAELGPALAEPFRPARPTVVVAPEVTGFLLGPLVAVALGAGFVEAYQDRREQAVAEPMAWAGTGVDYRGRLLSVGLRRRLIGPADRVLLVDDWVQTGAQLVALHRLVTGLGARVVGSAAVVDAATADIRDRLDLRALLAVDQLGPAR